MDDEKPEVHRTIDVVNEHCGALYLHDSHDEVYYEGFGEYQNTYCPGTIEI